ncbi:MAG: hypothetical protein Q7T05_05345 [Dehalococcoidia bacterium]|nr:hypothetical protein [Dehalococcoidia bacterium]
MSKAKWDLVMKAAGLVLVALALKVIVLGLHLERIALTPLITALVGGVIFTLAIIFTGVLADFKESEKIPAELAASLKSLCKDMQLVCSDSRLLGEAKCHVSELLALMNENLRDGNHWELDRIDQAVDRIDEDIRALYGKNVAPPMIARLRNEVTNIDRMSNRIDTIMKNSFIPAAYAISEVVVALSLVTLLFTKVGSPLEGVVLFTFTSFILVALLALLKDMDNPFEGNAKVDSSLLIRLEEKMKGGDRQA